MKHNLVCFLDLSSKFMTRLALSLVVRRFMKLAQGEWSHTILRQQTSTQKADLYPN